MPARFEDEVASVNVNSPRPPAGLSLGCLDILIEIGSEQLLEIGCGALPRDREHGSSRRDKLPDECPSRGLHFVHGVVLSWNDPFRSMETSLICLDGGEIAA